MVQSEISLYGLYMVQSEISLYGLYMVLEVISLLMSIAGQGDVILSSISPLTATVLCSVSSEDRFNT